MLILHTLGTARIDAGTTRLTPTSVRKFALLLHLSAEPGRRVPREVLRDLIFPDRTEDSARHSLRELVYGFRQLGVRIDSDKHGMSVSADAVASDYRELLDGERPDSSRLTAAAGGFLPGYAPDHSEAYTEWLEGYRARATFEICKVLLKELTRAKRGGDWAQAERAARACLALDPLNEEATLGLAEMLAIGGSKVAAVRLLDAYISEVRGGPNDLRIPASILRRRISEQAGPMYQAPAVLPFLGREPEMAVLADAIDRARKGEPTCIILAGEAGIGKSRLADEACGRAALDGFRIERVAAQPSDRDRPFAAFLDLVPKLRELPGALGAAPASLDALDRLITHKVSPDSSSEPNLLRSQITRGIDDLIEAISSEGPLLL
ncbi:MAG TPA: AAA family ATPase, partial [Gemmatimonadaceae bacterium]|nr:AAA family ATPase [Gemmatimonadaceae bacterium]